MVPISAADDTDSTEESDGEYDSEHDSDVDKRTDDDENAPDGVELDSEVDMDSDGDDDEEEDEEEEDEEKVDEEEVEEEDEDEEEDKNEDDGKERRTIGQKVMGNTSADDVNTMVDNQPIVLPEQVQKMHELTLWPEPPASAPWPRTEEFHPRPRILETDPLRGHEHLGLVTLQKPRLTVPTLWEAEAAGNTSEVDVDQQQLIHSASGHSLPNVPVSDVPLSDITLPNVPLPEARPDRSVGEECTSPHVGEEVMVFAFRLRSGSCLVHFLSPDLFISGIYYYTCREVFGSL